MNYQMLEDSGGSQPNINSVEPGDWADPGWPPGLWCCYHEGDITSVGAHTQHTSATSAIYQQAQLSINVAYQNIKSCESQTAEQRWLAASCLEIPLVSLVQDKYLLAAWLRWLAASWAVMSSVLGQGDKWRFTWDNSSAARYLLYRYTHMRFVDLKPLKLNSRIKPRINMLEGF